MAVTLHSIANNVATSQNISRQVETTQGTNSQPTNQIESNQVEQQSSGAVESAVVANLPINSSRSSILETLLNLIPEWYEHSDPISIPFPIDPILPPYGAFLTSNNEATLNNQTAELDQYLSGKNGILVDTQK